MFGFIRKPVMVAAIDVSGSVKSEVATSIRRCLNLYAATWDIWVIEFDAQIKAKYKWDGNIHADCIGGGTLLTPVVQQVKEINPNLVLCFTDGYFNWEDANDVGNLKMPWQWMLVDDYHPQLKYGIVVSGWMKNGSIGV